MFISSKYIFVLGPSLGLIDTYALSPDIGAWVAGAVPLPSPVGTATSLGNSKAGKGMYSEPPTKTWLFVHRSSIYLMAPKVLMRVHMQEWYELSEQLAKMGDYLKRLVSL